MNPSLEDDFCSSFFFGSCRSAFDAELVKTVDGLRLISSSSLAEFSAYKNMASMLQ